MSITLELDSTLQIQAERVAQAAGLTVSEWIMNLLRNQIFQDSLRDLTSVHDPLREGLFDGATDLAETSEDLLQREITPYSGWTWKTDKLLYMQTDVDLKLAGIEALNQALGIAGALKFLRLFNLEATDYVEISRRLYQHQSLDDIFARVKQRGELPTK